MKYPNGCLQLRTRVRYGVRMSLTQSLSELAGNLDEAVAKVETQTISAQEAATLLPLFTSLQRHINTFVSFTEARAEADNVHFLDQRSNAAQRISNAAQVEESATAVAEFAMVSGDYYGGEIVTSTWDDGRHFEWVGSQCIVSNG
jgi:hypothetical protein